MLGSKIFTGRGPKGGKIEKRLKDEAYIIIAQGIYASLSEPGAF